MSISVSCIFLLRCVSVIARISNLHRSWTHLTSSILFLRLHSFKCANVTSLFKVPYSDSQNQKRSVRNADCRPGTKCRLHTADWVQNADWQEKLFCFKKRTEVDTINVKLFTHAKTFHRVFTAVIDRNRITPWWIFDNKIFCTTLFWCSLKRPSIR